MTKESFDFQDKFLIPAIYNFLYEWEDWVELEFKSSEVKEFHFAAIRLLKGSLKPWRSWLKKQTVQGE